MKKRFLALLLAVSMAVSMLAMPAAALGSASNTAVQTAITLGGMDAGQTGSLDAAVTRGAFARMLVAFSAYRESAASQGAVGTLYKDVPGSSQWAPYIRIAVQQGWMNGYTDGTFGPSRSMTRSEAAAIFARLLAEKNGDTISTAANTKFADIPAHAWYSGYVKYLSNNGITYGKSKTIFAPNDAITRAEFTTMAVRFFDVYGDGDAEIMEQFSGFNDVSSGYWAAEYIKYAALHGWINGYGDGSFHADREINRAEVVTIVNRLLGREADEDYIADNLRKLNTFSDMSKRHWAYYAVMEAANAHTAILGDSESWSK